MDKQEMNEYIEAVDFVCLRCTEDTLNDETICEKCPVRKSMDIYRKANMEEKKYWYPISQSAEEELEGWIYLTEKEADFIAYASNSNNWEFVSGGGYCGSLWIDKEHKRIEKPEASPRDMYEEDMDEDEI